MSSSGNRLLIVDDSAEFVKFLGEDILPQFGYETLIARSGRQALRMMGENEPDVVLLDVQMPDLSGLEVLEEMSRRHYDLPVIMMTAHGSESIAVKAFQLGAKDYLMKPFDLDLAQAAIDRLLTQVRLQREKDMLTRQLEEARRDLERRVRELMVLFGVSKSVTSLLDLNKVLSRVVEAAVFIARTEEGALWLAEGNQEELQLRAGKDLAHKGAQFSRLRVADSLIGQVFRDSRPLGAVSDEGAEGLRITTGYLVKALLAVPLVTKGRTIGVLVVSNRTRGRTFAENDEAMLQALADYAAIAIENAQVYKATDEALARQVEEVTHLYDIARTVTSTLDQEEILDLVTAKVSAMFHVEAGALLLVDEQKGDLEFAANWLGNEESLRSMRLELGQGIAGQVALSQQPVVVNDAYGDTRFYSNVDRTTGFVTRSILCAPMLIQDRCIGVIELLNKLDGPFSQDDVERLCNVARSVAISLENARLYREARELHEAKSRFVATMARELRSPLTAIKGYSDMMLSGPAAGQGNLGAESAKQIRQNVDRIITLMEDLLDIARLETGETGLQFAAVPVRDVVAQVTSSFEQRLKDKNLRLTIKVPQRLPPVFGDRERISQVLSSMLTNAYCYTLPKGRIGVEAQVQAARPGQAAGRSWVVVSVSDTGIGIPPEEGVRVFERFFRGDHPLVRQHPGRGLSLSIAKSLVDLHHGQIWFESEPGRGSVFSFTLPLAQDGG